MTELLQILRLAGAVEHDAWRVGHAGAEQHPTFALGPTAFGHVAHRLVPPARCHGALGNMDFKPKHQIRVLLLL